MPSQTEHEIVLSLISHTNVGKTALARTLLRRDIGEVADSAHVTIIPESFPLIEAGDRRARLWDTPGFGANLAKLAKRLRSSDNPIGWLLHQVWDRATDRSLWCSQEAIRNVQTEADVVLYLVDASQSPEDTAYIDLEIEVIEWIGKPVLVFLNQLGSPDPQRDRLLEEEWRQHLSRHAIVRKVSTLDAFTRCWVQEHRIFAQAAEVLEGPRRETARLLSEAWMSRQLDVFEKSVQLMSELVYDSLTDRESLPERRFTEKVRQIVHKGDRDREFERAQLALTGRLAERTRTTVNQLIENHGLSGETLRQLEASSRAAFEVKRDVEESLMAVLGGVGSGLFGGLVADLLAGGFTLGGGAIAGMIFGGVTSYALAKGYNLAQTGKNQVRWTEAHFIEQVKALLLLYLAVAHYGRGRGSWRDPVNNPAHWQQVVAAEVDGGKGDWLALWKKGASDMTPAELKRRITATLKPSLVRVLLQLYPEGRSFLARA